MSERLECLVKEGAKAVVGFGIFTIVNNLANALLPPQTGTIIRLCTTAGSAVLGLMLYERSSEYIDHKFEDSKKSVVKKQSAESC